VDSIADEAVIGFGDLICSSQISIISQFPVRGFGNRGQCMAIEVLSVNRIGQISGTTGPSWKYLVDPVLKTYSRDAEVFVGHAGTGLL